MSTQVHDKRIMRISFEGKRVLITGGEQGIGKALALEFVKFKADKVYVLSKTKEAADRLVAEAPTIATIVADLCDWEATKQAVEGIEPVDILINNAGVFIGESFLDVKPESFDVMFSVNVKAIINVSQVVVKKMIERKKGGCIVGLSSQASKIALQQHTCYCATKAALDSITRVMALELGKYNIRAVTVGPTVVLTDMGRQGWSDPAKSKSMLERIPLHRFAEVEEIVDVILFLASDKAAMVNGTMIPIDGGTLAV